MTTEVVAVTAKRSAFAKFLGTLSEMDPVDLAAAAGAAALAGPPDLKAAVERVFVGNCMPASCNTGSVVGRQVGLKLGLNVFATTVDTACCSPLTALRLAAAGIRAGEYSAALVIGVEVMSRVPHLLRGARTGVKAGAITMQDPIFPIEYAGYNPVAVDAANGAARYGVTRPQMDAWAVRSHRQWDAANRQGWFADEVVPVEVRAGRNTIRFAVDESPRPDATPEKLGTLPPIFGSATITAGNAPGLNDGAAAMVIMSAGKARELGVQPLCRIVEQVACTSTPDGISWVPALAIRAALERAGLKLSDLKLLEINEAFAAMPLVSTRVLALDDDTLWGELQGRTNVNGGAVAIGHPVGASGLRIAATLAYELRRRGGGLGAAAICGGLAQAEAVIVHA